MAGAASSSVGYYFDSVTELLYEAGCYNIELWIARAEKVAQAADALDPEECRERLVDLLLEACLPDDTVSMPAHYAQLIAASEAPVVTEAYRKGREALDAAVNRILVRAGVSLTPSLVVALVDGGAVKAISEGYDVREDRAHAAGFRRRARLGRHLPLGKNSVSRSATAATPLG